MSSILPVSSTRTSDLSVSQRLLEQLQADQSRMLQTQSQISTGRRLAAPSDDAPAAIRAMTLQRLLEQQEQVRTNVEVSRSYLVATESAISGISDLLADVKAAALGVSDTVSSDVDRQAVADDILGVLSELVAIGNREFRGRRLFAGSADMPEPFRFRDGAVEFLGNADHVRSLLDANRLVETNLSGDQVFGALSAEVRGSADLNPVLTADTRLEDLHGGLGAPLGSFIISDGGAKRTIDISTAETVGDVVHLIESNPPEGRQVSVRIGPRGLIVDLDDAGGGNLSIRETAGGDTAAQLGILSPIGSGTAPLVGLDLDPRLTPTTRLADVLGVRASAVVDSPGINNALLFESLARGDEHNGVAIQFVDDNLLQAAPGLVAGGERAYFAETAVAARAALTFSGGGNDLVLTANAPGAAFNNVQIDLVQAGAIGDDAQVNYDPVNRVLTLGIDSTGATRVQTLIDRIAADGVFTAAHDSSDAADGGFSPTAALNPADARPNFGNTGNSGGEAGAVFVHIEPGDTTAAQVVAAIENEPAQTVASRFRVSLDDKDNPIVSAPGAGLIDVNATAVTAGGAGVEFDTASGIRIENNGEIFDIDISGAETVEDLLNVLNHAGAGVIAEINAAADGINLRSRLSGEEIALRESLSGEIDVDLVEAISTFHGHPARPAVLHSRDPAGRPELWAGRDGGARNRFRDRAPRRDAVGDRRIVGRERGRCDRSD